MVTKEVSKKYWVVLLRHEDREVADRLASEYYNYRDARDAIRQALRNELDRLEYRDVEKKRTHEKEG